LRIIQAKSFSRQIAMPWTVEMSGVWRDRKKLVSIILNGRPQRSIRARASGTFMSCMKPKWRMIL
jgi:hypothetical protein